jgi:hypothetical protein
MPICLRSFADWTLGHLLDPRDDAFGVVLMVTAQIDDSLSLLQITVANGAQILFLLIFWAVFYSIQLRNLLRVEPFVIIMVSYIAHQVGYLLCYVSYRLSLSLQMSQSLPMSVRLKISYWVSKVLILLQDRKRIIPVTGSVGYSSHCLLEWILGLLFFLQ